MMNSRWNGCLYNRCSVLSAAATFHLETGIFAYPPEKVYSSSDGQG
jgi:hypothetical protein